MAISHNSKFSEILKCVLIIGVESDRIRLTHSASIDTIIFELECHSKYRLYCPTEFLCLYVYMTKSP